METGNAKLASLAVELRLDRVRASEKDVNERMVDSSKIALLF